MNRALEVAFLSTQRFSEALNPINSQMNAVNFFKPI